MKMELNGFKLLFLFYKPYIIEDIQSIIENINNNYNVACNNQNSKCYQYERSSHEITDNGLNIHTKIKCH